MSGRADPPFEPGRRLVCGDVTIVRLTGEDPRPYDCLLPPGHRQWEHQHGNVRWTTKRADMESER